MKLYTEDGEVALEILSVDSSGDNITVDLVFSDGTRTTLYAPPREIYLGKSLVSTGVAQHAMHLYAKGRHMR